ncbi:hypothetical protein [Paraburkholderia sp. LEh10]|nr:hypothetical protein [Paraburkholderia sp. LEh10]
MQSALESRVSRKLMWRIIPFVMLLYFVSFLDLSKDKKLRT